MTRPIKFRAWDGEDMIDDVAIGNVGGAPYDPLCTEDPNEPFSDWMAFAVMQYTGLKDRDGKEIYEGDIVRWQDEEYPDGVTRYVRDFYEAIEFHHGAFQLLAHSPSEEFEVIGNIHENPELLEAKS